MIFHGVGIGLICHFEKITANLEIVVCCKLKVALYVSNILETEVISDFS